MNFYEIVRTIATAARKKETVEIYYPETENTPEGWREVEPYSLATDAGPEGEHLVYGADHLEPGHIFNAFTVRVGGTGAHKDLCAWSTTVRVGGNSPEADSTTVRVGGNSPEADSTTVGSKNNHCDSFILGKIKKARLTGNRFSPRWKIEF